MFARSEVDQCGDASLNCREMLSGSLEKGVYGTARHLCCSGKVGFEVVGNVFQNCEEVLADSAAATLP